MSNKTIKKQDWWAKESEVIDNILIKLKILKKALIIIANAHDQSNPMHLKNIAKKAIKDTE